MEEQGQRDGSKHPDEQSQQEDWEDSAGPKKPEQRSAYHGDVWFWRLTVASLAVIVLVALGGGIWLTSLGKEIPQAVLALGATAVGALGGVVAGQR